LNTIPACGCLARALANPWANKAGKARLAAAPSVISLRYTVKSPVNLSKNQPPWLGATRGQFSERAIGLHFELLRAEDYGRP